MSSQLTTDLVSDYFDDYEVDNFIAEGGQKKVFKATRKKDGGDVVVKLLEANKRCDRKRANREVRGMEEIDSPVLVELIESFELREEDFEGFVIVEEFIEGVELRQKIKNGENSRELGLKVLENVLEVLKQFDKDDHKIIHRDIKPSNIMIEPDGDVRLLDVGIARFTQEKSITPSFADRAPGTPQYSAPEQLANNKDLQDIRTDLFSLGITGFEAMTGKHPFNHEEIERIEDAISEDEKIDLKEYLKEFEDTEELVDFFNRMMSMERFERPRKPEFALEEMKNAGFI